MVEVLYWYPLKSIEIGLIFCSLSFFCPLVVCFNDDVLQFMTFGVDLINQVWHLTIFPIWINIFSPFNLFYSFLTGNTDVSPCIDIISLDIGYFVLILEQTWQKKRQHPIPMEFTDHDDFYLKCVTQNY